jgi:CP family cyanate transporter-like MFS transporter
MGGRRPARIVAEPGHRLAAWMGPLAGSDVDFVKPIPALVLVLAWFVAFNLRSGLVGLGPALPALTADLGLTFAQSSVLVSLPTLLMGLMAVPGGGLADRWGSSRVIALGLALLAIGGGLRAFAPVFAAIFASSIIFGAGIGIAQPPLPRLMRTWFPGRLGLTTGIYASGMVCGSIVGALISGLLLARSGGHDGWRIPIALWGGLAALGLAAWALVMQPWRAFPPVQATAPASAATAVAPNAWSPWRDRRSWLAAAIFGTQGLVYYLLIAWLPAIYHDAGASSTAAATLFAVFNAATLPGILLFPIWSDRLRGRRLPTLVAALVLLAGVGGLLLAPLTGPGHWLWPAFAGAGVAGLFGMALVLPADIAPRGRTGAAAGMVLAIGYAMAALGPVIAGVARDLTGSFNTTLAILPAIGLAMVVFAALTPELPALRRDGDLEGHDGAIGERRDAAPAA